jgi:hypothetical protein
VRPNGSSWIFLFSVALVVIVFSFAVQAQEPLTRFLNRQELGEQIKRWQQVEENSFKVLYNKELAIEIKDDAAGFIINRYAEAKLARIFSKDVEASRLVIKSDLDSILARSMLESIESKYPSRANFLLSHDKDVSISVVNIRAALQKEDCRVIPCPPDKCKPDCSEESFRRFTEWPSMEKD